VASGHQAIASEHRSYQDRSKKRIGQHRARSSDPNDRTVGPRAWAGRLIDLDTTLPVLSQQFEPVRDIDKQAVEKDMQNREMTLLAAQL
jgi:hypothetical protein